jgi:hypothetical protein
MLRNFVIQAEHITQAWMQDIVVVDKSSRAISEIVNVAVQG